MAGQAGTGSQAVPGLSTGCSGVEVVPASVLLQTLLAAAAELGTHALSDVRFQHPIVVDGPKVIQVVADDESVSIASGSAADAPAERWKRHVTARLSLVASRPRAVWRAENGSRQEMIDGGPSSIAEMLRARGVEGQPFPWTLDSCRRSVGRLGGSRRCGRGIHGGAARRSGLRRAVAGATDSQLYVPAAIEHVQAGGCVLGSGAAPCRYDTGGGTDEVIVDVIVGADREPAIFLDGSALRRVGPLEPRGPTPTPRSFAHAIAWQPWQARDRYPERGRRKKTIAVVGGHLRRGRPSEGIGCRPATRPPTLTDARYVLYVADSQRPITGHGCRLCREPVIGQVTDLVRLLAERSTIAIRSRCGFSPRASTKPLNRRRFGRVACGDLAGVIAAEHPEIWGGVIDRRSRRRCRRRSPRALAEDARHTEQDRFCCCVTAYSTRRSWCR